MADLLVMSTNALGTTGSGSKAALSDFPDENPKGEQLDTFLDAWDGWMGDNGYTPFLQGRDPPAFVDYEEQDLSDYPVLTAGGSITAEGCTVYCLPGRQFIRVDSVYQVDSGRQSGNDCLRGQMCGGVDTHQERNSG